jgi:aminoglycoside phosphotransferase (APT) family kinase protein
MARQTVTIDSALVHALITDQFPQWAGLPVQPMPEGGWDNRTFRVGDEWVARLPSAAAYEAQVLREQQWLPYLGEHLPLAIPQPVACGKPGCGFPWAWSIYRWIPGVSAASSPPSDKLQFATDLAMFLNALRQAPADSGPVSGQENFYRGGDLSIYNHQFQQAIATFAEPFDASMAVTIWDSARHSSWRQRPVWVHGDVALGNVLMREGRLGAVIDFGQLCVGDPACDLAIAWTYFRGKDRIAFLDSQELDSDTRQRGRAWALWKAAIVVAGLTQTNAVEGKAAKQTIAEVLADYAQAAI